MKKKTYEITEIILNKEKYTAHEVMAILMKIAIEKELDLSVKIDKKNNFKLWKQIFPN